MRLPDHVLGAGLFAISIAYAAMALTLPGGSQGKYGPAVFPLLIAAGMAASGILLTARRFRSAPALTAAEAKKTERPARNWLNGLIICAVVVYTMLLMPAIGFALTVGPALVTVLAILGVRFRSALLIGVPATFIIQFVFRTLLQVPLPSAPGVWPLI